MAKYKLQRDGVWDTELDYFISQGSPDYQLYLTWAQSNTPDPERTTQEEIDFTWATLRDQRDQLLRSTDYMMVPDYADNVLSAQEKSDVITYRQSLRDLPVNTVDPNSPLWPTKPQVVINGGI